MFERGCDYLAGALARLADAEASDSVAGKTDFDGAFGGFLSYFKVHAALDDAEEGLMFLRTCGDSRPRLSVGPKARLLSIFSDAVIKTRRASLAWTAGGGCPHMDIAAPRHLMLVLFEILLAALGPAQG